MQVEQFEKLKVILSGLKSILPIQLDSLSQKLYTNVKKALRENGITDQTFIDLSKEERIELGFINNPKNKLDEKKLIPLYIFRILDDETLLICPFFDNEKPKQKSVCSDDIRGGCVAYQFVS